MDLAYARPSSVFTDASRTVLDLQPELRALAAQRSRLNVDTDVEERLLFRDALLFLHDIVKMDMDRLTPTELARMMSDPIVTAHPDQMFFEAFSADESAYARVSLSPDVFTSPSWEPGTTNVDYSPHLRRKIEGIRTDRPMGLRVDPEGLALLEGGGRIYEKKIRVPTSWFAGLMEVQASMVSPRTHISLSRMDFVRILDAIRPRKPDHGPRGLVWELVPGKPITAVLQPWGLRIPLRAVHVGEPATIVTWGERRLLKLRPMLRKADRVELYLLGSGLPVFVRLPIGSGLGHILYGLTGWTDADWSSTVARQLFRPHAKLGEEDLLEVRDALKSRLVASMDDLQSATGWPAPKVDRAISALARNGELVIDLETGGIRYRSLRNVPDRLWEKIEGGREKDAQKLVEEGRVQIRIADRSPRGRIVQASVRGGRMYVTEAELSTEGELLSGRCECEWFRINGLRMGPCKHILAIKIAGGSPGA